MKWMDYLSNESHPKTVATGETKTYFDSFKIRLYMAEWTLSESLNFLHIAFFFFQERKLYAVRSDIARREIYYYFF